jgi:hypothetical protein
MNSSEWVVVASEDGEAWFVASVGFASQAAAEDWACLMAESNDGWEVYTCTAERAAADGIE